MRDADKNIDPKWAWEAYTPSKAAPWNLQRVGHLYRRAAFGATVAELETALKAGPEDAVANLLVGGPNHTGCHLDIPMRNCSLWCDDRPVIVDGDLVIDELRPTGAPLRV